jgi:hypothetical protein
LKSPNNNPATIASSSWKLEGDYFEGCNCDSICPCIFKGDPNEGNCNLTSAWHILNGNYDKINVDGLNVVGLFYTPGNMLTGPKCAVPGSDLVVARSTKYRYDDYEMKWNNSGKNGFYCKFRYSS